MLFFCDKKGVPQKDIYHKKQQDDHDFPTRQSGWQLVVNAIYLRVFADQQDPQTNTRYCDLAKETFADILLPDNARIFLATRSGKKESKTYRPSGEQAAEGEYSGYTSLKPA